MAINPIVYVIIILLFVLLIEFLTSSKAEKTLLNPNEKLILTEKSIGKIQLTVTSKRVFGCTLFGKRVDLPVDSITAVALGEIFHTVAITTSSGSIKFVFLSKYESFHKEISKLLIERQNKSATISSPIQQTENSVSNADELKKFKDLLDSGIITQEEFDQKKKQLLGL